MNHTEIINYLIETHNYKSYLEIGVDNGNNFSHINIENKESCDITNNHWELEYPITYLMPSDELFKCLHMDKKYDIIFIDGMHNDHYVFRDIINSLQHLNKGGLICVHDTFPSNAEETYPYYPLTGRWNGNVYKAILSLQDFNIEFYTIINNDDGLTIIKYFDNPYSLNVNGYKPKDIRYDYLFGSFKNLSDDNIIHYSDQGMYAMHMIYENDFINKVENKEI